MHCWYLKIQSLLEPLPMLQATYMESYLSESLCYWGFGHTIQAVQQLLLVIDTSLALPQAKRPASRASKERERNQIRFSRSGTGKGDSQPKLSSSIMHSLQTFVWHPRFCAKHREQNQERQLRGVSLSFLIHGHKKGQSYVHIWSSRGSIQ